MNEEMIRNLYERIGGRMIHYPFLIEKRTPDIIKNTTPTYQLIYKERFSVITVNSMLALSDNSNYELLEIFDLEKEEVIGRFREDRAVEILTEIL